MCAAVAPTAGFPFLLSRPLDPPGQKVHVQEHVGKDAQEAGGPPALALPQAAVVHLDGGARVEAVLLLLRSP